MASFCIPKEFATKLKKAAQEGLIKIQDLYEMTSKQRRELFEQFTNQDMAKHINTGFERAMKSDTMVSLQNWVEKTFTGKEKARQKNVIDRIKQLDEEGLMNPETEQAFLQDLVAEKLGATISAEEVKVITEKTKELEKLTEKRDANGNYTLDYWKARNKFDEYILSLTPASNTAVTTSTIGRGNLLFQSGSAITNTVINAVTGAVVNVENYLTEIVDSALQGQAPTLRGLNKKVVNQYIVDEIKMQVYAKRGLSRMMNLGDGIKQLGENFTHSQGKGAIRAIGRFYEDVVFNLMQGVADSGFAASSFAHTADLLSTKYMKAEGFKGPTLKKKAEFYLRDAMNVEPQTELGQQIRSESQEIAFLSTNTQDGGFAKIILGIRNVLDSTPGNIKLGSLAIPFAKTPTNAIQTGLERLGASGISGLNDFFRKGVLKDAQTGKRIPLKKAIRKIIQSGVGLTAAYLLAEYIDKNSYVGAYDPDPKVRQARSLMGAGSNMIKIGDKWVSTDYLGPLKSPFSAAMALKGGASIDNAIMQSVKEGVLSAPGVSTVRDTFDKLEAAGQAGASSFGDEVLKMAVDTASARLIPAFVSQLAKATDTYERQPEKGDPLQSFLSKVPGLRQSLPMKKDLFGNPIQTESAVSIFLAGSRITTAKGNKIVEALSDLDKTEQRPTLPDLAKPSGRMAELKSQLGNEKFQEAQKFYYEKLTPLLDKTVSSQAYKNSPEDVKKARIQKAVENATMQTLGKFKYKPPKKEHVYAEA